MCRFLTLTNIWLEPMWPRPTVVCLAEHKWAGGHRDKNGVYASFLHCVIFRFPVV